MIVACQWKRSSPTGPALQSAGGSRWRSSSSLLMRLSAMFPRWERRSRRELRRRGEQDRLYEQTSKMKIVW